MRPRADIEADAKKQFLGDYESLVLEVLLDIRDLQRRGTRTRTTLQPIE